MKDNMDSTELDTGSAVRLTPIAATAAIPESIALSRLDIEGHMAEPVKALPRIIYLLP
jgi:hypothetical protein